MGQAWSAIFSKTSQKGRLITISQRAAMAASDLSFNARAMQRQFRHDRNRMAGKKSADKRRR